MSLPTFMLWNPLVMTFVFSIYYLKLYLHVNFTWFFFCPRKSFLIFLSQFHTDLLFLWFPSGVSLLSFNCDTVARIAMSGEMSLKSGNMHFASVLCPDTPYCVPKHMRFILFILNFFMLFTSLTATSLRKET